MNYNVYVVQQLDWMSRDTSNESLLFQPNHKNYPAVEACNVKKWKLNRKFM